MYAVEFKDICTEEVCNKFIQLAEQSLTPATTFFDDDPSDLRIAEVSYMYSNRDPLISEYLEIVSKLTNAPISHIEPPQLVKYSPGGLYVEHYDFIEEKYKTTDPDSWNQFISKGGQRVLSVILYLNDNFEGGTTNFPLSGIDIKPKQGKLVIWKNVDESNNLDYSTKHSSTPIIKGTKYILVTWIREFPYKISS